MDSLTQLGAGGLIALLITREVLGFLKSKKGDGMTLMDMKAEVRHSVANAVTPTLAAHAEMLRDIKETNTKLLSKTSEMCAGIEELVDMNRRQRPS